ncbi:MAG: hypothetical protein ABIF10_05960 [Candidatus Woesearchaeota archaeon]
MGCWSDILEGYCCYAWASKKRHKTYEWRNRKFSKEVKIRDNNNYIPRSQRPDWCRRRNKKFVPQHRCLGGQHGRCPFFSFCDGTKGIYKWVSKYYDKKARVTR